MLDLPEPKPAAPAAGQDHLDDRARNFLAAVEEAMHTPTSYRDDTKPPAIGSAPPIPQPGRAPMSSGAVDYCARVLSTAVATALGSGSLSLILYVSRFADPVVCGIVFGAPIGLAVPIAALSSFTKRAKEVVEAAPPEIHNNYDGPVYQDQRNVDSKNYGVWVKNTNEQ